MSTAEKLTGPSGVLNPAYAHNKLNLITLNYFFSTQTIACVVTFTGRSRELGVLRTEFDQLEARCITVSGPPGVGVSALIRSATDGYAGLRFRCPPRPDPLIRAALSNRIRGDISSESARDSEDVPTWAALLTELAEQASDQRPFVLVLDDAHRLSDARSRIDLGLADALSHARAGQLPFHVVLTGRAGAMPAVGTTSNMSTPSLQLRVGPLPLRAAAPHLPGSEPYHKIRAYGVFGGIPGVLAHLDTSVTVGTNVRRLLLPDHGALADLPLSWLERSVQTPTRYVSTLEALSHSRVEWADLSDAIPDLTRSGQIAPYLKRLAELGLVSTYRSLDAAPRSRSTRYSLTDPFLAFWLRFILPWRVSERDTEIVPHYASSIRPGIRDHLQNMMPALCRRHMEIDALETFGSNAREGGAIWNADVDIPVAGTLGTGAVYYGTCLWDPPATRPRTPERTPLERLDRNIRETRYGFGRERRERLVFTGRATPTWLRREVARRDDARIVSANELIGDAA